jgi:SAM-dependent methyltransferase
LIKELGIVERVEVLYTGNKRETLEQYYDIAGTSNGRFGFLSPVKWPEWLSGATDWMYGATNVAEVGCGYGEFVGESIRHCGEYLKTYYLIDISQVMLNQALQRAKCFNDHACVRPLKKDITIDSILEIAPNSLEKVVAINVLQDIDALAALTNIHNLLRPEGQLRATFIRRDTQDLFWMKDENYDTSKGCLYNFSSLHEEAGIEPLGYVIRNGEQKPFYRVQTYFTKDDVLRMLADSGYELSQMKEINFPLDIVKTRWSSGYAQITLDKYQENLLQEWGYFPDAWDVVAMKL